MKKNISFLLVTILFIGLSTISQSQDFMTHDFNDGTLGPFETTNLNRMTFVNNRLQTDWKPSDYSGVGTSSKKTEFRAKDNAYEFKQEFWTGFWLKVHGNTLANNPNTEMSVMQTWGFRADGNANHYFMLKYEGNGSLTWQHRYNMGSNFTRYTIYPNFPKDKFVRVVIRVKLRNLSDGIVQVWIDDELMLDKSGQTIGFGDQNENGQHSGSYSTPGSWGMYNYANEEYVDGETRTVTYDDVSLWNGPNGYNIVDPNGGRGVGTECGDFDAFSTTEAEDYCDMLGIQKEYSSDGGGEQVGYIQDGDWLKFDDFDFGNGASSFNARVSSDTSGGDIELRLGSPTGTRIGVCAVPGTGSWTSYTTISCDVNGASGVQDLYLVFKGDTGYLLNINWFEFSQSEGNCNLPWSDDDFSVEASTVNYSSGVIDISCASNVEISMDLEGTGSMENADYLNVFYKVDGGPQQVLSQNVNAFSEKTVSVSGISGNRLEILANVYTSYANEIYSLSNIDVSSQSCTATSSTIQAENFDGMSGVVDEGMNIGYIENGDWVMYRNIDLSCISNIELRTSSQTAGGRIEVRLGNTSGTIIGTVDISGTGNWNTWQTNTADLSNLSGTHDVYLVFTGNNGYLFNIDWLEFSN